MTAAMELAMHFAVLFTHALKYLRGNSRDDKDGDSVQDGKDDTGNLVLGSSFTAPFLMPIEHPPSITNRRI